MSSASLERGGSPRGQVLVITAVALIILLGVAALVVDLGFAVLLRRQEQNAVDPGAIAAARFIDDVTGQTIDMPNAWQAACHYARQNGFFPTATDSGSGGTGCVPANDPQGAVLEVVYPPDSRAGPFQGHARMVQVVLTRQRNTFFGQLLGFNSLSISTDAVAARQRGNTNTHTLIALDPEGCAAGWLHGNGTIQIYPAPGYGGDGGYVQVNSNCGKDYVADNDCDNQGGALRIDGVTTELIAPEVDVHGGCRSTGDQITGILDEGATPVDDPLAGLIFPAWDTSVDGATCGVGGVATRATGPQSAGCRGTGMMAWAPSPAANCPGMLPSYECVELQPGVYYGGWDLGADRWHLKLSPGIYIIAGGGITMTTDSISSVSSTGSLPAPILIYNTDNPVANCPGAIGNACQDDLDLQASGTLALAGLLASQPCPPVTLSGGCPLGGMLIWYEGRASQGLNYSGYVDIEGGVELFLSGTIYAPKSTVDIHGNAQTNCSSNPVQVASVQIISWRWKLGGTGDLCMPYDPSLLYHLTLQGLVH